MVVIFAVVIAARARIEIAKEDILQNMNDSTEDEAWVDADGNPIIATE